MRANWIPSVGTLIPANCSAGNEPRGCHNVHMPGTAHPQTPGTAKPETPATSDPDTRPDSDLDVDLLRSLRQLRPHKVIVLDCMCHSFDDVERALCRYIPRM